ncbi:YcaO-like family protein [Yoonia sediminilitoris]|uniref:Ribosomal protein S12 methylthiotransferase accessory factor n=1 Tax=Yoonia sediminilitoris TaxID=1286148 RepID=A0A2T6KFT5_9RHOB|nr:YcaO-like family protein [Yoonia sediminilitoris]PUB14187.1 ribosomal protein S12 methylthiotransferase accessory factor [Yoonia sediminilitoris]RCW95118.1 ribosomal protein S12 methylthiotransferase accessory factor [Yoonia sediminilitoris]
MTKTRSSDVSGGVQTALTDTRQKCWQHRICPPQDTLEKITPYLPRMGITRLADITGLDRIGIPVAQAIRPLGRSLSVAQGKGMTLPAARVSAAMEAAEGWHAENLDGPFQQISGLDLMEATDLESLPMSDPPVWDQELTILEGRDIIADRVVALPIDLIGKDYTQAPQHKGFHRTTNGLASGNSLTEAIVSGLHELIERDCIADFAHMTPQDRAARLCHPHMLDACTGDAKTLLDLIASAGFHVFIHDLTNDIGVPAMRATLFSVDQSVPGHGRPRAQPGLGCGCHLDPQTALVRAITEAAQSRLTCIAGARDDLTDRRYDTIADGNLGRLLEMAADLQTADKTRCFDACAAGTSPMGDLDILTRKLTAAGLEKIYVVDLSKADLPIHVVRVFVPGLGYLTSKGPTRGNRYRSADHE